MTKTSKSKIPQMKHHKGFERKIFIGPKGQEVL